MESAQEGTNIRTATIYPAAINTELLGTISDKDTAEGFNALYAQYAISSASVANIVAFALEQPEDTNRKRIPHRRGKRCGSLEKGGIIYVKQKSNRRARSTRFIRAQVRAAKR
jgi:hypothetical protein